LNYPRTKLNPTLKWKSPTLRKEFQVKCSRLEKTKAEVREKKNCYLEKQRPSVAHRPSVMYLETCC
jgi:hypothetical protein